MSASSEKRDFDLIYNELSQAIGFEYAYRQPGKPANVPNIDNLDIVEHRHPYHEAWVDEDYAEIDRIRQMGRFLVEDTKRRMADYLPHVSEKQIGIADIYNHFRVKRWYDFHPDIQYGADDHDLSNSILPENIAAFPEGGYVNCLGVAIGMTAFAELAGKDYLFANELRSSDDELAANFMGQERLIKQLFPGCYDDEGLVLKALDFFDTGFEATSTDKRYARMPITRPDSFDVSADQPSALRDYHHYLLIDSRSEGYKDNQAVASVDPYSLTFRQSNIAIADFEDLATSTVADKTFIVSRSHIDKTFRLTGAMFNEVSKLQPDSKISQLKTVVSKYFIDIGSSSAESANLWADFFISNARWACAWKFADYLGMDQEVSAIESLITGVGYDSRALSAANSGIKSRLRSELKYNKALQDLNNNIGRDYLVAVALQAYRYILQYNMQIYDSGLPNKSLEIGETDFTIGSMALNHYANTKKDGNINVAKYLARYSSSQLIWLAGICDGDSEEDPSLQAVGEQVKLLSPAQMHPRIHLVAKR